VKTPEKEKSNFATEEKRNLGSHTLSVAPDKSMKIVQELHFDECQVNTVRLEVGRRVDRTRVVILV
jgi:hypothetical protein